MLSLLPISVLLLPLALAVPAPNPVTNSAAQQAINWGAGALSRVGDKDTVHAATTWGWFDCGEKTDAIQIKDIKVSPDPPEPGKDLTVTASGTTTTLIDDGAYADVVVKLGLIKLLTKRFDVCEELSNANATLQCPVKPDEYVLEQTVALPEEIPRAKFLINVRAFTQTEQPMACVDLAINFLAPNNP